MNTFMSAVLDEALENKGYAAAYILVSILAFAFLSIYVNPLLAVLFPVFIFFFEKKRFESRGWKKHKEEDKE